MVFMEFIDFFYATYFFILVNFADYLKIVILASFCIFVLFQISRFIAFNRFDFLLLAIK
jgi:hypothetical protein